MAISAAMEFFVGRATKKSLPIHVVAATDVKSWLGSQPRETANWLRSKGDGLKRGSYRTLPGKDGKLTGALVIPAEPVTPWTFASLPAGLPRGRYELQTDDPHIAKAAALGWGLGNYQFTRYRKKRIQGRELVWPTVLTDAARAEVRRLLEATFLVRDLVTTPANDMGPADLEATAKRVAKRFGAKVSVIRGDRLLEKGFPAVHAVGRASTNPPAIDRSAMGADRRTPRRGCGQGRLF